MENLPKNWVETDLMNLCEVYTGKKDANFATENGKYNFFTCAYKPLRSDSYSFEGNVLILPGNGVNVGEVFYFSGKFEAYQRTYIVNEIKIDPKYLFYHFRSFWREIGSLKQFGSATNYIKIGNFKDYKVQFPPLPEQQSIVAKLDTLFGHLDSLKQRLDHIPTLLKQFRQSVLTQAVTGKLTEKWREGKELGEWEEITVGDFMMEVKTKMNPIESEETNYIGLEHILKDGGIIGKSTSKELKSSKTVFKKGDVLYGKLRPYLNKHDLVPFEGVCSTDILVYRNSLEESCHFFNYYLGTENFIKIANSESKGINLPRVSSKTINKFNISVPPKEEQTEIVSRVEALFSKADTIEVAYNKLNQQIDNLPQAILAKAFKGELVEQLPTDGDAKELLKEIAALRASLEKEKKSKKKKKVNA